MLLYSTDGARRHGMGREAGLHGRNHSGGSELRWKNFREGRTGKASLRLLLKVVSFVSTDTNKNAVKDGRRMSSHPNREERTQDIDCLQFGVRQARKGRQPEHLLETLKGEQFPLLAIQMSEQHQEG